MAVGSAISGMHTQIQMATAIGGESMGRLIDADAIEHCLVIGGRRHGKTIISEIIRRAIQTAPTVDAVPVIRCKDCKFSMSGIDKYNERYILCQLHERSYGVIDDGFCSWAERRNDEIN